MHTYIYLMKNSDKFLRLDLFKDIIIIPNIKYLGIKKDSYWTYYGFNLEWLFIGIQLNLKSIKNENKF